MSGPWEGLLVASAVTQCLQQWACMQGTTTSRISPAPRQLPRGCWRLLCCWEQAGSGVCPVDVTTGRQTAACPRYGLATGLGRVPSSSPVSQCPFSPS